MRKRSEARARPQKSDERRRQEEDEEKNQREFLIEVPNDPLNEMIVLAAMMVDTATCDRLLPLVPGDAFYAPEHRIIREGLAEMRRRKLVFDPAIFMRIAPDADLRMVENLPMSRPDVPEDIDFAVDTLLWDWRRAQAARGSIATFLDVFQDPKSPPDRVRSTARAIADAFEGKTGRGRFLRDGDEVVRQMMKKLRERIAGEAYYPYGIDGLDRYEDGTVRLRPGASPGTMTLVTALSGSGKSTLVAHIALGLARQRRKVLFGAWEENAPTTIESLTTLALKWSRSRVLDGKSNRLRTEGDDDWAPMTHEDLVVFEDKAHAISKLVTFFDNPFQRNQRGAVAEASNDAHLDTIQEHIEESGCDVFIADLLARAMVDDRPSDEKHFLYRMLSISEETRCHTIAAHQQRAKDIEARAEKAPTREGIIGSGAWLDVFWTVIAPHIPAKWKNVPDNTIEGRILKQRNGPWPIAVEFGWEPDTGQITGGRSFKVNAPADASDPVFAVKKDEKKPKYGFGRSSRR